MDLLPKIGIYIGIIIGLVFFAMFMIMVLPHTMSDAPRQWEEAFGPKLSDSELRELFYNTTSYKAFIDRYPNAGEEFRSWEYGRGNLEVTAMNYTTNNQLDLNIEYDRDQNLREQVRCETHSDLGNIRMQGSGSAEFIEKTKCLEGGYDDFKPHPRGLVPEPHPPHIPGDCLETTDGTVCTFG